MNSNASPSGIFQVGTAFMASKVLLAAIKMDLFTKLGGAEADGEEIRTSLGIQNERLAYDFLDTLYALGFLKRDGLGKEAVYSNTTETKVFLDRSEQQYIGGIMEMNNDHLYGTWSLLEQSLVANGRQTESMDAGKAFFEETYSDENRLRKFIDAMGSAQIANFMILADSFDFSKYASVCDIGGAGGLLSIQIALKHPGVNCVTYDLPAVEDIARQKIEMFHLSEQVRAVSGNFLTDDLPEADIITMGNVLHDWNMDVKKMLIKKAYEAVRPGGGYIVVENIIDDDRSKNIFGLLMSMNMSLEFGDAFEYTGAEFMGWVMEAGFRDVEFIPLTGGTSAVVAYK